MLPHCLDPNERSPPHVRPAGGIPVTRLGDEREIYILVGFGMRESSSTADLFPCSGIEFEAALLVMHPFTLQPAYSCPTFDAFDTPPVAAHLTEPSFGVTKRGWLAAGGVVGQRRDRKQLVQQRLGGSEWCVCFQERLCLVGLSCPRNLHRGHGH